MATAGSCQIPLFSLLPSRRGTCPPLPSSGQVGLCVCLWPVSGQKKEHFQARALHWWCETFQGPRLLNYLKPLRF